MSAAGWRIIAPLGVLLAGFVCLTKCAEQYHGTKIGTFKNYFHGVVGDVFAVDDKTIFIKGFSYDGEGPDAYFWGGTSQKPDSSGFIIPDEKGRKDPLNPYRNKDVLLRLPAGKTLRNIKWLSVWCRKFNANFADVFIPADLAIPQPAEIGKLPSKEHGVSSGPVMVVDTQTLLVPDFTYDGQGPAAYWWVSRGARQHPRGQRLADENGSLSPLPRYKGKTVVITLPDDQTIYDFDWFGVWCDEAAVDFGSVQLPQDIVVPPSPRMLGVELEYKLNCEILHDQLGFEIRWIMDGEDIIIQLVAKLEPNEYMSFGLSKNDSKSQMVNADAVVAWIGQNGRGNAVDYFLGSKEQCVGQRGSCPDTKHPDGRDSVSVLNTATVNGYTMITFKRPQVGLDDKYDQHVYSDGPQAVVWAIGPLNNREEVSYHNHLRSEGDVYLDFARPPQWNCPQPTDPAATTTTTTTTRAPPTTTTRRPQRRQNANNRKPKPNSSATIGRRKPVSDQGLPRGSNRSPDVGQSASSIDSVWHVPPIVCPEDRTFRAQIGPAGGKKGYQAITGEVGWGIAWYINGLLIPEITVQRGKTYTFIAEGGHDPENSARHHPFYIADDPEGGFEHKTLTEKRKTKVFAGVTRDRGGRYSPSATGRLCEWRLPRDADFTPDDFQTYEEFHQNLELKCEDGKGSRLRWRPDQATPDLVYYQCYTHRYLGWKIHVVDSCDSSTTGLDREASIQHLKNVTYNSLVEGKTASDFKRGQPKLKLTEGQSATSSLDSGGDASQDSFLSASGNDGIPLVLSDPATESEPETVSTTTPPSTEFSTRKEVYFQPTYVDEKLEDKNRKLFTNDGAFTLGPESASIYTFEPSSFQDTTKHFSGVKTVVHKPSKATGIRSGLYPSTRLPSLRPTSTSLPTTVRDRTPWWKPIGNHPSTTAVNRRKAIQALRSQLAVIRSNKQDSTSSASSPSARQPFGVYYENGFVPVVIRNNSTFDRAVANIPSDSIHHPQITGSPLQNSSTGQKDWSALNVPVLVPAGGSRLQTIRRTTGQSKKNFINTPLGHLPFPDSSPRRKTSSDSSQQSSGAFLPVLVPTNRNNTPTYKGDTPKRGQSPPLIPLVVPEKKGDNLYILHHVLSLIGEDGEKSQGRNLRIIPHDSRKTFRARIIRSATEQNNSGDHNHHHRDHGDHHQQHEKPKSGGVKNNSYIHLSMVTMYILWALFRSAF